TDALAKRKSSGQELYQDNHFLPLSFYLSLLNCFGFKLNRQNLSPTRKPTWLGKISPTSSAFNMLGASGKSANG
ncbi:MAG: hypothetical protein AAFR89_08260, partial [Cyanobacteria bacterium J06633_1]